MVPYYCDFHMKRGKLCTLQKPGGTPAISELENVLLVFTAILLYLSKLAAIQKPTICYLRNHLMRLYFGKMG